MPRAEQPARDDEREKERKRKTIISGKSKQVHKITKLFNVV